MIPGDGVGVGARPVVVGLDVSLGMIGLNECIAPTQALRGVFQEIISLV